MAKPKETEATSRYATTADTTEYVKLPFLAINIASEKGGKDIPVKTFNIIDTDNYSKTVRFRPLLHMNKIISMYQDDKKQWKSRNETIFYKMGETPIDARGTIACGRLLGKAIPLDFSEQQKKENKAKGSFYGFLFGYVEFPGKEPVLCNFRVPGGKAVQVSQALAALDKAPNEGFTKYWLNFKLTSDPDNAASPHPVLVIEPDMSKVLSTPKSADFDTIDTYIDQHNVRIRKSYDSVRAQLRGDIQAENIMDDLNDEIGF